MFHLLAWNKFFLHSVVVDNPCEMQTHAESVHAYFDDGAAGGRNGKSVPIQNSTVRLPISCAAESIAITKTVSHFVKHCSFTGSSPSISLIFYTPTHADTSVPLSRDLTYSDFDSQLTVHLMSFYFRTAGTYADYKETYSPYSVPIVFNTVHC